MERGGIYLMDINFDFRQDCPPRPVDPDCDSEKLKECHKKLWSKQLPNGEILNLKVGRTNYNYLSWNNIRFSSDTMNSSYAHTGYKQIKKILPNLPKDVLSNFQYKTCTIGNFIIFPKGNGKSINQDRGSWGDCIKDRFDLTLRCIQLFYENKYSPLNETFARYKCFFDLFICFEGYVKFFLLQDIIDNNGKIKFLLGTGDFGEYPLPESIEDYLLYINNTSRFIDERGKRMIGDFVE